SDAGVAVVGDFVDELHDRVGRGTAQYASRSGERTGLAVAAEAAAGTIGIAFFFAQIDVDAAVESATQHIVHQVALKVFTERTVGQVGKVANANFRLRSTGLVDEVERAAGQLRWRRLLPERDLLCR